MWEGYKRPLFGSLEVGMISKHKQTGLGLIEILVSILVIAVGVAGIVKLQQHIQHKSALNAEYLTATRVAQQKFETLRQFNSTNFSEVVVSGASNISRGGNNLSVTTNPPNLVTIATGSGLTSSNQLRKVTIDVDWTSLGNVAKDLSHSAFISPVSMFSSDGFLDPEAGRSSASGPALNDRQNASSNAHIPPVYDVNENYYPGDLMLYDGKIYSCKTDLCKQAAYKPGGTAFPTDAIPDTNGWSFIRGDGTLANNGDRGEPDSQSGNNPGDSNTGGSNENPGDPVPGEVIPSDGTAASAAASTA